MERPRSDIISFIAKQLKYKTIPPDVLVDVCILAYSTSEIVNTRNIVIDAFEENIDYAQPLSTHTTNIRGDLLRIFRYLEHYPCAVGQEREYTEHIESLALVARLDGMSQVVRGLCNMLKQNEESMPSRNLQTGECSNAAGPGNQEASAERQENAFVQPVEMPINQELNMQQPAEHAIQVNNENWAEIGQFHIEDIHDEPERVGAELQALSVNPPTQMLGPEEELRVNAPLPNQGQEGLRGNPLQLMVSTMNEDARVSSVRVEWVDSNMHLSGVMMPTVQQPTDQALTRSEPIVDAPTENRGASSKIQDDSYTNPVEDELVENDPVEDDLSSLSSEASSHSSTVVTSEEDQKTLSIFNMITDSNGPTMMQLEPQEQVPRPVAPPAGRFQFERLPEPSQPILIPTPIRLLPDWVIGDESLPSDLEPPGSKRARRMDRTE